MKRSYPLQSGNRFPIQPPKSAQILQSSKPPSSSSLPPPEPVKLIEEIQKPVQPTIPQKLLFENINQENPEILENPEISEIPEIQENSELESENIPELEPEPGGELEDIVAEENEGNFCLNICV